MKHVSCVRESLMQGLCTKIIESFCIKLNLFMPWKHGKDNLLMIRVRFFEIINISQLIYCRQSNENHSRYWHGLKALMLLNLSLPPPCEELKIC